MADEKPSLSLLGRGDGTPPSFDEVVAMTRKLTGREPTEPEVAEARAEYEDWMATLQEAQAERNPSSEGE